jgi:hypothetical protein
MTVGLSKTSLITFPFLNPSSSPRRLDLEINLLSILDSNFLLIVSVNNYYSPHQIKDIAFQIK